jgi:hypothetical protein
MEQNTAGAAGPANISADAVDLGSDTLRGVSAIAEFLGVSRRRAQYLVDRRYIPTGNEGSTIIASRRGLRAHYARSTQGEAAA